MSYLTRDAIADWLQHQPDDALFCEDCMTKLTETQTETGLKLYCPNEACLNDEQYDLPTEEE